MKSLYSWLLIGFGVGLFTLSFDFLFDGLGLTRVNYWENYHGSMSWPAYRVTFRPQGTAPAPDLTFPTLRYGFNPTDHVVLKAQLLQSELPTADTGPILYDTTRYARFSPDSVYYAWIGLRGNAFSFALGSRPGFVVLSYQAAAAPADIPNYPVQTDWRHQWQLYAWASLSLQILFMMALAGLYAIGEESTGLSRTVALLLILLFTTAAAYVDWYDYTTGGDWPIMKPLLVLALLAGHFIEVFSPASSAETEESPAVEPPH